MSRQIVFHLLFQAQKCHWPKWVRQEIFCGGPKKKIVGMNCHSTSRSPVCRARCKLRPAWVVPTVVPVRIICGLSCINPHFKGTIWSTVRYGDRCLWHIAFCGQNQSCAEKGALAYWVSALSRTTRAQVKDGCMLMTVDRWEMFPPWIAGVRNSATFFSVFPWRAHILQASLNLKMNSAAPCVGPG